MTKRPANIPITIYPGRKFTLSIRLLDLQRDPLNLTGFSIAAEVKTAAGGTTILALDAAITNAATGLVTLSKSHTDTTGLTAQRGVWDIMLTNASSEKLPPYVGGPAEIKTPVTD